MPIFAFAPSRLVGRTVVEFFRLLGTDIGRDAEHLLRMFDTLPDATARRAFVRTIRAVVDWRGQAITMLDRCYLTRGMPTLLMWGRHDAVLPFHHAEMAHAAMPNSRLEVFEEAGHFPHHQDRDRFIALLRDFVATTAPASYSSEEWRELLRQGRPAAQPHATLPPPSHSRLTDMLTEHVRERVKALLPG
jgi:pimeloyl-ACP methyl ester carboxylesterase